MAAKAEESTAFSTTTSEAEVEQIAAELRQNGKKVNTQGFGYAILRSIGFEMEVGNRVAMGRFVVSENSCQPFGVLHGGTTAHIAESIASEGGGFSASGRSIAGVDLNVNHLRPAPVGHEVLVIAKALMQGRSIQVWEVKFEARAPKSDGESAVPEPVLVAVARVTLKIGRPLTPEPSPKG